MFTVGSILFGVLGVVILMAVFVVDVVLRRIARREQEIAERLALAARLRNGPRVRSYHDPAAKGFQKPGGGTAA